MEPIPEYTAREELEDEKNWRSVTIGDKKYKIDMKVIEPYKKVLSHGGEAQTSQLQFSFLLNASLLNRSTFSFSFLLDVNIAVTIFSFFFTRYKPRNYYFYFFFKMRIS